MPYRTIMVIVADDPGLDRRLASARLLAQRYDAFLRGLHVMPLPIVPVGYGEAAAYVGPELIEAQRRANQELADQLRRKFEDATAELVPEVEWRAVEGEPALAAVDTARTVDLTIAPQTDTGGLDALEPDIAEHLAMDAGGPVLVLPRSGDAGDLGRHVLIAWNGSRQACRAVHDALPMLGVADRVELVAIGEEAGRDLEDAAAMLTRHGLEPAVERLAAAGNVGQQLLAEAERRRCDLLVMGAYGHSRLRELILGGATRHVLQHTTLAVLLSS